MAATQPFPNTPNKYPLLDLLCAFGQNWNATSPTWTSIIGDVRFNDGLSFARGRQDEIGQFQPGSIQGVLNNTDRRYDPSYTAGVYYPNLVPGTPFQLIAYWPTAATAYPLITGTIEDWIATWDVGGNAVCNFMGVDFLGSLAFYQVTWYGTFTTTAGARLAELANKAGIPAANQNFLTGSYTLAAQGLGGTDVLSLMQKVTDGQREYLYVSRGGTVTSWAGVGFDGGVAFGGANGLSPAGYPLHRMEAGVSGQYLYTQVQITPDSGTVQGAPVGGSMVTANVGTPYTLTRYGNRIYSRSVAAMTTAMAQSVATAQASALAAASIARPKQATIKPAAGTASWDPVLKADFGTIFTYNVVSPGAGGTYTRAGVTQHISHRIGANDWTVTFTHSNSGGTAL